MSLTNWGHHQHIHIDILVFLSGCCFSSVFTFFSYFFSFIFFFTLFCICTHTHPMYVYCFAITHIHMYYSHIKHNAPMLLYTYKYIYKKTDREIKSEIEIAKVNDLLHVCIAFSTCQSFRFKC